MEWKFTKKKGDMDWKGRKVISIQGFLDTRMFYLAEILQHMYCLNKYSQTHDMTTLWLMN